MMDVLKNSILVHKICGNRKYKVTTILSSRRVVVHTLDRKRTTIFHYDQIWRDYNIIPPLSQILKKL